MGVEVPRPQQNTSIRVATGAHQAAVQRAKAERPPLDLIRVVELILRDALSAGIVFDDEVVKSHGSRDYKTSMGFNPGVWQDEKGEFYAGYEETQSKARVHMIVGAINLYASGQVDVVHGTTLRRQGEGSD